jgi:hypothetical protein
MKKILHHKSHGNFLYGSGSGSADPYHKSHGNFGTDLHPHPDPDQLVRGTDPQIRIRIRSKMSRIRNY